MKQSIRIFITSTIAIVAMILVAPKVVSAIDTYSHTSTGLVYTQPVTKPASQFSKMLAPIYLAPKTIQIGKLGINSELEEVGVVNDRIGVPSGWMGIGYYDGSARAGETGNTIIVGHLDDNYGRPAAFWNIKLLSAGDEINLSDGHRIFTYRVIGSAYVPDGSGEPLMENLGKPGLMLVTCGGVWNPVLHNYSERLLVKAVLVS